MKETICTLTGLIGGWIASLYGGWTAGMTTLLIFMACDYVSGMVLAGIFHKSEKTKSGGLESKEGLKGLCRKGVSMLVVLIAYRLDITIGTSYIRDAVVIALITNELISITENAGRMGAPIPPVIIKAIDVLQDKSKEEK